MGNFIPSLLPGCSLTTPLSSGHRAEVGSCSTSISQPLDHVTPPWLCELREGFFFAFWSVFSVFSVFPPIRGMLHGLGIGLCNLLIVNSQPSRSKCEIHSLWFKRFIWHVDDIDGRSERTGIDTAGVWRLLHTFSRSTLLPRLGSKKQWQSAVLLLKNLHLRSIERNLCRINTDRKQMQWVIPALISKVSINAWYVCCFKVEFLCTQDFRNEYAYSAAITACEKSTLPTTVVSTGMVDVDGQAKSQAVRVRWEMEHCSGLIGRTTTTRGRVTKLQNGLVE